MKTLTLILTLLLTVSSFAQTKLNDTIGGIILTSHRYHKIHSPFTKFETTMYYINPEDGLVLKFLGLQPVMSGKVEHTSLKDSVLIIHFISENFITHETFHHVITYDLKTNYFIASSDEDVVIYKKVKYEFRKDQAWYYIPD